MEIRLPSTNLLLFGVRLVGAGLGFATQILLARLVAPSELGAFFFWTGAAALSAVLVPLGYPSVVAKLRSRYSGDNARLFDEFLVLALRDFGMANLAMLALAGLYLIAASAGTERLVMAAALAAVPALAAARLGSAVANADRRFLLAYVPDLLVRPLLFLAAVALAAWCGATLSALTLTVAFAVFAGLTALPQLRPLFRAARRCAGKAADARDRRVRLWRRSALPLVVVSLATAVYGDVAVVGAGLVLPAHDLAVLAIAVKLASLVGFAVQVSHQTAAADLADALRTNDRSGLRSAVWRATNMALVVTGGATLLVAVFGRELMSWFGPDYVAGASALVVLMLGQTVRAALGPITQIAMLSGRTRELVTAVVAAIAAMLSLLVILGPIYGPTGAAVAVAVAPCMWSAALAASIAGGPRQQPAIAAALSSMEHAWRGRWRTLFPIGRRAKG